MCDMLERPLLYIVSPTYMLEHQALDESTSVYERHVPEKISALILRQLHYFARAYKPRSVILVLASGERVLGEILGVHGAEVKVMCFDEVRVIHAHTIVAIDAIK